MSYQVDVRDLPVVVESFDDPPHQESPPLANMRPSVSLVFEDQRACNAFVRHLEAIQSRKTNNPTLALALSKLVKPPTVTDVLVEDEQT